MLGWDFHTTKDSTPQERQVIVWCLMFLLIAGGVGCLWFGFADTTPDSIELRKTGFGCLGLAVLIWLAQRLIAWLMDRV